MCVKKSYHVEIFKTIALESEKKVSWLPIVLNQSRTNNSVTTTIVKKSNNSSKHQTYNVVIFSADI